MWLFLFFIILIIVGSYIKIKVGELVWIRGDECNNFVSGYGLVIERNVTSLEDCHMVDVMVLHNGDVYRPMHVSSVGVADYGI
tara:strand:+ start:672 stop:920 length:249 start_codon:yes stop_codon:yes gene_type:complete